MPRVLVRGQEGPRQLLLLQGLPRKRWSSSRLPPGVHCHLQVQPICSNIGANVLSLLSLPERLHALNM